MGLRLISVLVCLELAALHQTSGFQPPHARVSRKGHLSWVNSGGVGGTPLPVDVQALLDRAHDLLSATEDELKGGGPSGLNSTGTFIDSLAAGRGEAMVTNCSAAPTISSPPQSKQGSKFSPRDDDSTAFLMEMGRKLPPEDYKRIFEHYKVKGFDWYKD
mmetsp:Transcript_735/g.2360  ORF Transcript_735/g.2360 Transcript_735/m.2360 type:complete len:160 (-) Transcript_735:69-548(-)